MRAPLAFDPRDHDYGPASTAVRTILTEWAEVEWFEPSGTGEQEAALLFREHHALAHGHAPDLFPDHVEVQPTTGGWQEFAALCERVRSNSSWDWKYSVLKKLSNEHAKARGWTLEAEAQRVPKGPAQPGALFFRFDSATPGKETVIWQGLYPTSTELDHLGRDRIGESATFYLGYAHGDVIEAIQWQLAERHDDLAGNPFLPLVRCYRAGFYPFSLGPSTVELFRFAM